ncbi:MAG: hypothetical protein ACI9MR_005012, partial [Myxococcota bacterium]
RPHAILRFLASFAVVTLLAACGDTVPAEEPLDQEDGAFLEDPGKADSNGIEGHGWEATCVLRLVNRTDTDELDDDARQWGLAARGIANHRAGRDGRLGTDHDRPFTSLEARDGVSCVGYFAFQRLLKYAQGRGRLPGPVRRVRAHWRASCRNGLPRTQPTSSF